MVNGVLGPIVKPVEIERPTSDRNGPAHFPNLVAFSVNGQKTESLLGRKFKQWSENRRNLGVLIISAVRSSKHSQVRYIDRRSQPRACRMFRHRSGEPFEPQ